MPPQRGLITVHTPDVIHALCLAGLSTALGWSAWSGSYTQLATPRTLPFLVFASLLTGILALLSISGRLGITPRKLRATLVAVVIPTLAIVIPLHTASTSSGFDEYAGGRAIAITTTSGKGLHGLDRTSRHITISNDEFADWYQTIDHNPSTYVGYTVTVTGFVSRDDTSDASESTSSTEFGLSRQFMSCCILDMTPIGFTSSWSSAATLRNYRWISVTGTLTEQQIGRVGHRHQGVVLAVSSVSSAQAPTGYFYQP
ncbi:TIGR03943 family protein [uncultured Bifidobacterium sp.]|uniref:TIGR03943 family putative permease subunit n=1 Tax=uncultured Bifidobacterium sp. TaxID=165187 RepID=UPI002615E3AF|nr:TIGR03943 family protein [uncultured Bifidobacterium sp.]